MKVLLVPSVRAGMGSGHLRRALRLARVFGSDSALLIEDPGSALLPDIRQLLQRLGAGRDQPRVLERHDPAEKWDLVLLDRRCSSTAEAARFFPTPVVGLDEGGAARQYLSYLVDALPALHKGQAANLSALTLLDLPERKAAWRFPFARILLSFGGEDPADLSSRLLGVLLGSSLFRPEQITVVQGPYFRNSSWPAGVTVIENPADLKSRLHEYDLVFTSYGLTCFEALAAGVAVLNLNPSRYHRRLSRRAGIPEVGVRRPAVGRLRRLLAERDPFARLLNRYGQQAFSGGTRDRELPRLLRPSSPAACPVCRETLNRALARFADRSYFRCHGCGILYRLGFAGAGDRRYDQEYFFSEYRKQYGKTYLEDFQAIKTAAARRLDVISGLLGHQGRAREPRWTGTAGLVDRPPGDPRLLGTAGRGAPAPRLLDVGCAYGPFLQAARERGFAAEGVDISPQAARYVREELHIPCRAGDFLALFSDPREAAGAQAFDVLSFWYVIEHFSDTAAVLENANRLLRPGGVLAFSTPSASGISARKDRRRFLGNSPPDHCTVWPLSAVGGILQRFGFRLRRLVVTGHHGERFPWPAHLDPGSPPASFFTLISRGLRLGDTFEAYASKTRELP